MWSGRRWSSLFYFETRVTLRAKFSRARTLAGNNGSPGRRLRLLRRTSWHDGACYTSSQSPNAVYLQHFLPGKVQTYTLTHSVFLSFFVGKEVVQLHRRSVGFCSRLSLSLLVMASVSNVHKVGTESIVSDVFSETIHETMTQVFHFARWRVERYMLKHNIRPIPVYGRELDYTREIDSPTSSLDSAPRVAESFLDPLTKDIIVSKVWPLLLEGLSKEDILAST